MTSTSEEAERPGLAIVVNSLPPYRVQMHVRIAREILEVNLWTVSTHEGDARWIHQPPVEINPVSFGPSEPSAQQGNWRFAVHEWKKGGRVIRFLKEQDVRVVVLHGYNDTGRIRILWWCFRNRVPCLISADSNIRDDDRKGRLKLLLKQALLRPLLKLASGFLPCGTNGTAYFRRYGAKSECIYRFPIEPDFELIRNIREEQILQALARFNLKRSRRRIVFSGRLISLKRVELLVDAFTRIAEQRPDWDLLVIGDGELLTSLQQRVPERLADRVCWTGHLAEQDVISALYRASDILVLPSVHESWALVVLEATAAGLALVTSHGVGAAVDFVIEGVNGYTFKSGTVDELCSCLLKTTNGRVIDQMKSASTTVLSQWRQSSDPIAGLRCALGDKRVIDR